MSDIRIPYRQSRGHGFVSLILQRALGGEGLYEDIHGQGFNKSAGWDWDKATKADIGTSAGFWLTNSVLITIGMTNVATGTGILTAWAISTAVGSLLGGAAAGTPTGG
jgi:ABC-type glycerol-3-phosphate transport system permease component